MKRTLSRRHLLAGLSVAAGSLALPGARRAHSAPDTAADPKFLIVVGCFGGASIIDSFLPIRESESANGSTVNAFPDAQVIDVPGSPIRAVDLPNANLFGGFSTNLSAFVAKHKQDMLVATMTGTSVNHTVAQKRSITGNGAWSGRTLQEAVAAELGGDCPLPNVNMSSLGFATNGDDESLPSHAFLEPVSVPTLWPFALHGSRGVKIDDDGQVLDGTDPALIDMARQLRNTKLDPESQFYTTFQLSPKLQRWKHQRNNLMPKLEAADAITKVNALTESPEVPLSTYGLDSSADAAAVQAKFPNFLSDPLESQAALAYLLIKNRISVTVTIGPNFNIVLGTNGQLIANPPLSFDYSHQNHRNAQAFMWKRMTTVIDGLIDLLKGVEFAAGQSFWDRTMIYCATDFGRSKTRGAGATTFGTGHDLNNGVLAISPMLKGNQVLGGVDPDTALTYGFNPTTGAPEPGREMQEGEIYAGLVQALGLTTSGSGLPDMPAMRTA